MNKDLTGSHTRAGGSLASIFRGLSRVTRRGGSSTSHAAGPALIAYRAPLLIGLLLLVALAGWAVFAWHGGTRAYREQTQLRAGNLAMIVNEARRSLDGDRPVPLYRLETFLARVIARTPIYHGAALIRDGRVEVEVGEPSPRFAISTMVGQHILDQRCFYWFALGPPRGSGEGEPRFPVETWSPRSDLERLREQADQPLPRGAAVLVLATSSRPDPPFRQRERRRILQTFGIGTLGISALVLAWIQSNRQRRLSDRLKNERSERARWQELSLAASGLAHETKNPLGIIRGLAQRIVDTADGTDEDRDRARQIVEQADRAASRLGDFLSYARMREPDPDVIDLGPLLERAVGVLQPDFEAAGVPIRLDIEDARIRADREMLMQIFLNLVLNSLEASEPGQALEVSFSVEDDRGRLSVRDHGRGIEPAFLPRVFKPYVSGRPEGHGLGLAIVMRFIEQHGWTVAIDSTPGEGTRIDIDGLEVVVAKKGRQSWHGF